MDEDGVPSTSLIGSPPIGMSLRSWVDRSTQSARSRLTLTAELKARLDRHRQRVLDAGRVSVQEAIAYWNEHGGGMVPDQGLPSKKKRVRAKVS